VVGYIHPTLVCYAGLDYSALVKYGMRAWRDDHRIAFWLLYQLVEGDRRKALRDLKNSASTATRRRSIDPISFTT
jgi:hypothetical protein